MRRRLQRRPAPAVHGVEGGALSHRLVRWERRVLYAAGSLLLVSGAAWLLLHYLRPVDALPSPAEPWLMRAHGIAAFATLFVFGALAAGHVPRGWRLVRKHGLPGQRATGLALCGGAALLALTGYLLYYFAPESLRPTLGWIHSAVGAATAGVVLTHRRGGDRA